MSRYSPVVSVMVSAARKAARGIQRDFGEIENLQVSQKGPADFVTAADMKAEQVLRDELGKARPGYGFLMEERGEEKGSDPSHRWIVDPIDGTTNFMHGIPVLAISIALERDGTLVAGLVYNPITDELFWAERGKGAFLNERRLRVANRPDLADAVIATGIPHRGRPFHADFQRDLARLMPQVAGLRRMGAAAIDLAYVAAGRFDGFWERGLNPWDIAAGMLLVREAGGFATDLSGRGKMFETGEIVAGGDAIHQALLKELKAARQAA